MQYRWLSLVQHLLQGLSGRLLARGVVPPEDTIVVGGELPITKGLNWQASVTYYVGISTCDLVSSIAASDGEEEGEGGREGERK